MQQIEVRPSDQPPNNKEETYKQLYVALTEYRFGRITFLELLDIWEKILNISPSSQRQPYAQQEKSWTTI